MLYVGLDVSVGRTAVCIMDAAGHVVREQSVASTPEAIATVIRAHGVPVERVGLEAGINSAWLARGLLEAELPAIVIDATHAAASLRRVPQQDGQERCPWPRRPDAREQVSRRVGEVACRPARSRATDGARAAAPAVAGRAQHHLVHLAGRRAEAAEADQPDFQALVMQALEDEVLAPLLRPLVAVAEHLDRQVAGLDKVMPHTPRPVLRASA